MMMSQGSMRNLILFEAPITSKIVGIAMNACTDAAIKM